MNAGGRRVLPATPTTGGNPPAGVILGVTLFVLTYDRGARELIEVQAFGSSERDRATAVRLEKELAAYAADADLEVVTLEADSLDDLRRTHRAYFVDVAAELLAG